MGSKVELQHRTLCLQCRKSAAACLCKHLQPFATHTHFVILMHPKEARKEKVGTGRLTHLSLINSRIIVGENFDDNREVQSLLTDANYFPVILYPGKNAISLETSELKLDANKKLLIFVIDGTWACAKSMMRDSVCLHNLPRLSFANDKKSIFSIKQQPSNYCLSTIESIYKVLEGLKIRKVEDFTEVHHQNLMSLLEHMCKFQKECAADPARQRYRPGEFKERATIKPSKKWQGRKIYFELSE